MEGFDLEIAHVAQPVAGGVVVDPTAKVYAHIVSG
jgi:hypothetical protein